MSTVADALGALKTALAAVDPSPSPSPSTRIWRWPDDYASMAYDTFPFIIVAQMVNRRDNFSPQTHGTAYHNWAAEIMICLAEGPRTGYPAMMEAESLQGPWLLALARVLFANRGLGGTVLDIGFDDGRLFEYQIGQVEWDVKSFWGIHVELPITQNQSLPVS